MGTVAALFWGFEEGNDFGFGKGEVKTVDVAPHLCDGHHVEELLGSVSDEAEVIDEKEDDNEEEEGGGGDADVGEPGLEGADEVRNVEAPEEGGEATSLCEALEELGEGVGGVVAMENADFYRVMESPEVLPDQVGDAVVVEDEEELFTEHAGKSQGDVPEKDVGGTAQVMFPVEDVGSEGVGGVERLPTRLAGSLGGGEEVALVDLALEFEEEALLPDHAEDIAKGNPPVVDGVHGVEGGHFSGLVYGGEEVT